MKYFFFYQNLSFIVVCSQRILKTTMAKKFNPMLSGYNNYNYFAFFLLPSAGELRQEVTTLKAEKESHMCVIVHACVWEREEWVRVHLSLSLSPLAVLRIRKIRIPLPSFFALHAHARAHTHSSHTLSLIFLCLDRIRRTQGEWVFHCCSVFLQDAASQSHDDGLCIPDVNYYIGQQNMQRSIQSTEIINYWGNNNEWTRCRSHSSKEHGLER